MMHPDASVLVDCPAGRKDSTFAASSGDGDPNGLAKAGETFSTPWSLSGSMAG